MMRLLWFFSSAILLLLVTVAKCDIKKTDHTVDIVLNEASEEIQMENRFLNNIPHKCPPNYRRDSRQRCRRVLD